jgi:hypothetical protein
MHVKLDVKKSHRKIKDKELLPVIVKQGQEEVSHRHYNIIDITSY